MRAGNEVILQVEELTTRFHLKRGTLKAVDRVHSRSSAAKHLAWWASQAVGRA